LRIFPRASPFLFFGALIRFFLSLSSAPDFSLSSFSGTRNVCRTYHLAPTLPPDLVRRSSAFLSSSRFGGFFLNLLFPVPFSPRLPFSLPLYCAGLFVQDSGIRDVRRSRARLPASRPRPVLLRVSFLFPAPLQTEIFSLFPFQPFF